MDPRWSRLKPTQVSARCLNCTLEACERPNGHLESCESSLCSEYRFKSQTLKSNIYQCKAENTKPRSAHATGSGRSIWPYSQRFRTFSIRCTLSRSGNFSHGLFPRKNSILGLGKTSRYRSLIPRLRPSYSIRRPSLSRRAALFGTLAMPSSMLPIDEVSVAVLLMERLIEPAGTRSKRRGDRCQRSSLVFVYHGGMLGLLWVPLARFKPRESSTPWVRAFQMKAPLIDLMFYLGPPIETRL